MPFPSAKFIKAKPVVLSRAQECNLLLPPLTKEIAKRVDQEKDVEATDDDGRRPQEDAVEYSVHILSHHARVRGEQNLQDDRPRELNGECYLAEDQALERVGDHKRNQQSPKQCYHDAQPRVVVRWIIGFPGHARNNTAASHARSCLLYT